VLGAERVRAGDVVVAMGSSGLHANGYSLARHVVLTVAGWDLGRHVDDLGRTIGEELLEPTRVYARDCLALIDACEVHALSHVTGGGLAANVARVVPAGLAVTIERASWQPGPVFTLLAELGGIDRAEAERTFNQGVGMVAIVAPDAAATAVDLLRERGVAAWVAGSVAADEPDGSAVESRGGRVTVVGDHAAGG
jgi:phosphoribosylformylglycinamidine cyclo-ligase